MMDGNDNADAGGHETPRLRAEEWTYLGEGKIHLVCHYKVHVLICVRVMDKSID